MNFAKVNSLSFLLIFLFSSLFLGCGSSSSDDVGQQENRPPVAKIESFSTGQGDISAFENQSFTLNATGSSDPDSDALGFLWEITKPSGSDASFIDNSVSTVTFKPDVAGDYSVKLTVSDASASDVITLTFKVAVNTPPQADAGSDQVANLNDTITLSSANSTDADGHTLSTFAWAFKAKPTGSNATITGADSASASFTVDTDGAYEIELTVTDEFGESGTDTVTVSTQNIAPVACTSGNITDKKVSETAMLDGSCSSDINGDNLTYTWTFKNKPDGSNPALDDATAVKPSFQIDKKGEYVVSLVVNDGKLDSPPAEQKVNAINSAPVANAGADQALEWGETVTLTGAESSDIDGDNITFAWSFLSRPDGSGASLNDAAAIAPQFVVDRDGDYQIQLIVSDGELTSNPDTVLVTGSNVKPVANFGDDRSVQLGQEVCFDASSSSDANGDSLTYKWSITTKPDTSAAALSASDIETPCITPDIEGVYIIQLIVNDGLVDSDAVTVNVSSSQKQLAPLAKAGADIDNVLGLKIELDGSNSSDPNGEDITYAWSVLNKPDTATATLSNATISQPELAVNLPGDYLIQLIVNDGIENSAPDQVLVKVVDGDPDNDGLLSSDELKIGLDPTAEITAGSTVKDGDRDHDNDNVLNKWERELSYAIDKDDTDSNGTLDGDEDFDKDGLSNAQEIANGTDPKDPKDPGFVGKSFSFELKNAVVTPGGHITYLISVSNPNQSATLKNAQIQFDVPKNVSFSRSVNAVPAATSGWGSGSIFREGNTANWALGDIESGQSKLIHIIADVSSSSAIVGSEIETKVNLLIDGQNTQAITQKAKVVALVDKPLSFEFVASDDAVVPMKSYTYNIDLGNTTTATVADTKITVALPKGVVATDLNGGVQSGQSIEWSIGNVDEGVSLQRYLTVQVSDDVNAGSILNAKATLAHSGGAVIDQEQVASVTSYTELPLSFNYELRESTVTPNGKLNYFITVGNTSTTTTREDVIINLRVPRYIQFSRAPDAFPAATRGWGSGSLFRSGDLANWNLGDLKAGESKTIQIEADVLDGAPAGHIIQSGVFLTAKDLNDPVYFEKTARVISSNSKLLSLELTASDDALVPGESFTYSLDLGNPSDTLVTGTKISVLLPKGITATDLDGGKQSGQMIEWSIDEVAAAVSMQKQLKVKLADNAKAATILNAKAILTHDKGLEVDQEQVTTVTVYEALPLTISYEIREDIVKPDGKLNYLITVGNTSTTTKREDVVVDLRVPSYIRFSRNVDSVPWASSGWGSSGFFREGHLAKWDLGDLEPGQSKTIQVEADISNLAPVGHIIKSGIFISAKGMEDTLYFEKTARVVSSSSQSSIGFEFTANDDAIVPGESYQYIANLGLPGGIAYNNTLLRVELPEGVTAVELDGGTQKGQVVEWVIERLDSEKAFEKRTLTVMLSDSEKEGQILNARATITNNEGNIPIYLSQLASVTVHKAMPLSISYELRENTVVPGGKLHYLVTVGNTSTTTVRKNVNVSLRVPKYLSFNYNVDTVPRATSGWGSGNLFQEGSLAIWNLGDLAPGQSKTIQIEADVSRTMPINILLRSGFFVSADGLNDTIFFEKTAQVIAANNKLLDLELTTSGDAIVPGDEYYYVVDLGNDIGTGAEVLNTKVSMELPGGVKILELDGGTQTGQVVEWSVASLPDRSSLQKKLKVQLLSSVRTGTAINAKVTLTHDNGLTIDQEQIASITAYESIPISFSYEMRESTVVAGGKLHYAINVGNTSSTTIRENVRVRLRVPQYIQFNRITDSIPTATRGQGGGNTFREGNLADWELGNLAPGQSKTIMIQADVLDSAPAGHVIQSGIFLTANGLNDSVYFEETVRVVSPSSQPLSFEFVDERDANYNGNAFRYYLNISNPTNKAINAELSLKLPTDVDIQYELSGDGKQVKGDMVFWSLEIGPNARERRSVIVAPSDSVRVGQVLVATATLEYDNNELLDQGQTIANTIYIDPPRPETFIRSQVSTNFKDLFVTPRGDFYSQIQVNNYSKVSPLTNIVVKMFVPKHIQFARDKTSPNVTSGWGAGGIVREGNLAVWKLDDIPPEGLTGTIAINADVLEGAVPGDLIRTTVVVTADELDDDVVLETVVTVVPGGA